MEEKWVELDDYPNYAVSSRGRVWNMQRDTILAERVASNGSLRVALSNQGVIRHFYIHQLVFMAFMGDFRPQEHIIHFNGDKEDNRIENLRLRKREKPSEVTPIADIAYERAMRRRRREWGRNVVVVETGDVFRTVRDCANYINGDYGSIYRCLREEQGSHKGYTFQYYDEVA